MRFKKSFTLLIGLASFCSIDAQITITDSDLATVNDTVCYSVKQSLSNFDQNLTGANYTWDYSFLVPDSQRIDKLLTPSSTGYPLVSFLSTYALPNPNPDQIPFALLGSAPTDAYNFYKKQSSKLSIVFQGITTAGNAVPIPLSPADIVYNFPINFGDSDTSDSGYAYPVPGFGYFRKLQTRVNTVDGWGTLTTPYGTFNTIRVKSAIMVVDSIYLDTLGFGFNLPLPTLYEFKWLAQGSKFPVLEIDATGAVLGSGLTINTVLFQDSLWTEMSDSIFSSNTCPNAKQGSAAVFVTGGRYPYSYSWSNGAQTADISNLDVGSYDVTITDRYGHTLIASATVATNVADAACLEIPNAFTPDGDGVNDNWNIKTLTEFKNCKVEIYNQWGSVLFSSTGYTTPWDGKYNNKPVEAGTYYYVIDLANGYDKYNGSVTIIK